LFPGRHVCEPDLTEIPGTFGTFPPSQKSGIYSICSHFFMITSFSSRSSSISSFLLDHFCVLCLRDKAGYLLIIPATLFAIFFPMCGYSLNDRTAFYIVISLSLNVFQVISAYSVPSCKSFWVFYVCYAARYVTKARTPTNSYQRR
jgi:hypothetical protein